MTFADEFLRTEADDAADREHHQHLRGDQVSNINMGPTLTQRLCARADRLEEEARGLRRLARDLEMHEANVESGGFAFTEEAKVALWRLAKL